MSYLEQYPRSPLYLEKGPISEKKIISMHVCCNYNMDCPTSIQLTASIGGYCRKDGQEGRGGSEVRDSPRTSGQWLFWQQSISPEPSFSYHRTTVKLFLTFPAILLGISSILVRVSTV